MRRFLSGCRQSQRWECVILYVLQLIHKTTPLQPHFGCWRLFFLLPVWQRNGSIVILATVGGDVWLVMGEGGLTLRKTHKNLRYKNVKATPKILSNSELQTLDKKRAPMRTLADRCIHYFHCYMRHSNTMFLIVTTFLVLMVAVEEEGRENECYVGWGIRSNLLCTNILYVALFHHTCTCKLCPKICC